MWTVHHSGLISLHVTDSVTAASSVCPSVLSAANLSFFYSYLWTSWFDGYLPTHLHFNGHFLASPELAGAPQFSFSSCSMRDFWDAFLSPNNVKALKEKYPTACVIYQYCVVSGRGSEGPVFMRRKTRWQCVRQRKKRWGYRKPYQLPSKTTTMSTLMLHQSDIQFYWHCFYFLFYACQYQSGGIKQSSCPSVCPSVCLTKTAVHMWNDAYSDGCRSKQMPTTCNLWVLDTDLELF